MTFENNLKGLTRRKFIKLFSGSIGTIAMSWVLGSSIGCSGMFYENLYENSRMANELHKVYPLTREITRESSSVEEAVSAVVQWSEKNFFHYYEERPLGEQWFTNMYDPPETSSDGLLEISIEDVFRERAVGCHFATFIMATMLRSIGISAEYLRECNGELRSSCGHGVLYVPEIDKYVHGDLIADLVGTPAGQIIQSEEELLRMCSADGGYLSFSEKLFEKYCLKLHRTGSDLYVCGVFQDISEEEKNEILDILSDYNLILQPEINGSRWVNSDPVPIVRL